ncbi:MAG: thioredoxin domain-containing protein [Magnetococcales bacterium]|nr:thioredoxin domain-containing protein [Magnetococcales bacterium]
MNRKTLFLSVAGALLLSFVAAVALYQQYKAGSAADSRHQAALHRESAPIKGPLDAKVTVVEFLDPACGTCRDFYPLAAQWIEQYPGKVRVMVRYAPLHSGSDQVVKMLEAARLQGQFWQALEKLFETQNRWVVDHVAQPMRARAILGSLELDQKKFSEDLNRPEIAEVVQQDLRDGQTLKVRATPEFFVNGRPLPSFGQEPLNRLIQEAVEEAY